MWREFDTPGGIHPFFLRAYGADGRAGPTETIESAIVDTSPTQIIVIPSNDSTWLFVQAFNLISGPQFWVRRRTADGRWSEAVKLFDLPESHRIDTVKPFLFQDRHLYFFTGIANRSALPSGIYVNMKVFDIGAEGSASELFSLDLYSLSDAEFGGFDATFDEAGRWFVAWGAEPHGTLTSEIRTANGVQMEPVYRSPDYSLNASFSPNVDAVNPRLHLMRDGTPVLVWNQFYQQILPSLPLYRAVVGRWDGSKWITPTQGIGSTTAPTQSPLLLANCADQLTVLTPLYPVIVDAIMATEFR